MTFAFIMPYGSRAYGQHLAIEYLCLPMKYRLFELRLPLVLTFVRFVDL